MATQSPPLVSLQPPKDVSLSDIEAELTNIWQSYGSTSNNSDGLSAVRAATFTFVVYEPESTQQLLARLGYYTGPLDGIEGPRMIAAVKAAQKAFGLPVTGKVDETTKAKIKDEYQKGSQANGNGTKKQAYSPDQEGAGIADAIASTNPCRIIALFPMAGEDEGVTAQVSAYCPIQKQSQTTLICCEYITLRGTAAALERMGGIIEALMIGELPKFIWWKAIPDPEYSLFKRLAGVGNSVIVDSSSFNEAETALTRMHSLLEAGRLMADLNWRRLSPWQELTAAAFDPPERRDAVQEIDRVTIDYEKGNSAQAWMFLGWLASRLQWRPVSLHREGGDYELIKVTLQSPDQRTVEAELAAIPTADTGDIPGDLIGLRLTSTNENADCCTVLCSETTGCMRMEAGGGAQSCQINQVTPLFDQNTEFLLSQQLRRWGSEMLYEESLAIAVQILEMESEQA